MSSHPGIDHIAVAVEDLDASTALWRDVLGLQEGIREEVASQGVVVQMMHAGPVRVELVWPTGPDTPVGKFLAKRGPGIHHLALSVPDCAAAIAQADGAGARMIHDAPQPGAHGTRIAFVHPQSTGGTLVELVEDPNAGPAGSTTPMEEQN